MLTLHAVQARRELLPQRYKHILPYPFAARKCFFVRRAFFTQGPAAPAAPAAPTTKVCPYCQTEIPIKAVRCPHCTSKLEGFPEINA